MVEDKRDDTGMKLLDSIAPLRDVARRLVAAAQAARSVAGRVPGVPSPALDELAAEGKYAGAWGQAPLHLAQSSGNLCLGVAEDVLETLCSALDACPGATYFRGPAFGQAPLARSVVESAGRAAWLLEPGISYEARAARAEAELLYSRWERARATDDFDEFHAFRDDVKSECTKRELAFNCGGGFVTVGEDRPGNRRVVEHLFRSKSERFRRTMYSYYSGISHATLWALLESVDFASGPPSSLGPDTRLIYTSTRKLLTALTVAAEGYRLGVADQWAHMGWGSSEWDEAVEHLEATVLDVVSTYG